MAGFGCDCKDLSYGGGSVFVSQKLAKPAQEISEPKVSISAPSLKNVLILSRKYVSAPCRKEYEKGMRALFEEKK